MLQRIEWLGTLSGIIGACLLASNTAASPWGYPLFAVSAVCWTWAGALRKSRPMLFLNGFYIIVNLVGILRWFNVV
jgi:hypothetical protein